MVLILNPHSQSAHSQLFWELLPLRLNEVNRSQNQSRGLTGNHSLDSGSRVRGVWDKGQHWQVLLTGYGGQDPLSGQSTLPWPHSMACMLKQLSFTACSVQVLI